MGVVMNVKYFHMSIFNNKEPNELITHFKKVLTVGFKIQNSIEVDIFSMVCVHATTTVKLEIDVKYLWLFYGNNKEI